MDFSVFYYRGKSFQTKWHKDNSLDARFDELFLLLKKKLNDFTFKLEWGSKLSKQGRYHESKTGRKGQTVDIAVS